MAARRVDRNWMWHPQFTEERSDTAGLFVHFRRTIFIDEDQKRKPIMIRISADTRYKLYANRQLVAVGPVKGDQNLWFYDEVNLVPHLKVGENEIQVHVLRFFHATTYASSFPRLPLGGLMIMPLHCEASLVTQMQTSSLWETAIDLSATLPTNFLEDDFLHIYESHDGTSSDDLEWVPAQVYEFEASTGLEAPWKLHCRMIPPLRFEGTKFIAVHNIRSALTRTDWERQLIDGQYGASTSHQGLVLPARTSHYLELEVENHVTAFLRFRFQRPKDRGSTLMVTYSECYEDPPPLVPYLRRKSNRRDDTKSLYGPQDKYTFRGSRGKSMLGNYESEDTEEVFIPFHFRTFRFLGLQIDVGCSDLVIAGIEITMVNYPLDVLAGFVVSPSRAHEMVDKIWSTSVRTLLNCMHDCYEDCPFYEQLQYAMDTRSSSLFTYYVSGDDRLARQAIVQIHRSFQARLGLTSSRAPCHQPQLIPHFSLFWICMLRDNFNFFGDAIFIRQFVSVVDGILEFFNSRLDPELRLVATKNTVGVWDFVDWTEAWRPYGCPPAVERTGFSSYTNCLYAYTLKNAAALLQALGRPSLADEYIARAEDIIKALKLHCFDGHFFTDGLAKMADRSLDYSQHGQTWAVLSGAATGLIAQEIMRGCLDPSVTQKFQPASISMSFYVLRALSLAGGDIYNEHFPAFWDPWRKQLDLNLTTWEEDSVSQRSDCHAWGSVPIYDFLAEVAGVRPAGPGWEAILFQPRLSLYPELVAKVPIRWGKGGLPGIAHVAWFTEQNADINVSFRLEIGEECDIPVTVHLPFHIVRETKEENTMSFVVRPCNA
ncbi:glycoside hydrolase family 78 protein [Oidiodendron maius Zn]|uniref:Glycoside hydrolase family 78 protein n=1 Tax=Oidiodendron maius (strain Zn) TaxID=913774 RepID=A0A0C3C483_OIDMZ|nr:glycoside hydrolase family 78 protein [Oidiodendron maius Zn]